MGDLSENFSKKEFVCRCCGELIINPRLIESLQALRNAIGLPIRVLSGYRCIVYNKTVGGGQYSQHLYGRAADIRVEGMDVWTLLGQAEKIPAFANGGIGIYPEQDFVHVDVRKKKARW